MVVSATYAFGPPWCKVITEPRRAKTGYIWTRSSIELKFSDCQKQT